MMYSDIVVSNDPNVTMCCDGAMVALLYQAAPTKTMPTHVPANTRDHLATPCGLLFNELLKSPKVYHLLLLDIFVAHRVGLPYVR